MQQWIWTPVSVLKESISVCQKIGFFSPGLWKDPERYPCALNKSNPAMEPFGRCLRWHAAASSSVFPSSKWFLSLARTAHTVGASSHVARAFWPRWALKAVTHTSSFMCLGLACQNPRTVLLGCAWECDGLRWKTLSGKKSLLADALTRYVAASQSTFLVGVAQCFTVYHPGKVACAAQCDYWANFSALLEGQRWSDDLDLDSLIHLEPSSSNWFSLFQMM